MNQKTQYRSLSVVASKLGSCPNSTGLRAHHTCRKFASDNALYHFFQGTIRSLMTGALPIIRKNGLGLGTEPR